MPRHALLSATLTLAVVACGGRDRATPPPQPVATTPPLTVSGPDSILGMLQLVQPADGSGLLPGPLQLRAAPSDSADTLVTVTRWQDVLSEEVGYEEVALVIWRMADPWYLVATRDTIRGWIRLPDSATVIPLGELLPNRLSYLTAAWDGGVRTTPGAGEVTAVTGITRDDRNETPADVHESRLVNGVLWLRVTVFEESPCEGVIPPKAAATGWIPAYVGGKVTAWYYSRGC
jgi:hypothetical protein